jgi:hypothetical protein
MTDLTQTRRPSFLARHKCAALVATTLIAITIGTISFVDSGIFNVSASYPDDPLWRGPSTTSTFIPCTGTRKTSLYPRTS